MYPKFCGEDTLAIIPVQLQGNPPGADVTGRLQRGNSSLRAAFHRHFPHRPQIGPLTRGTRQYTLPHQINREVNIITFLVILALNLGNYPRIWPSTILIYG